MKIYLSLTEDLAKWADRLDPLLQSRGLDLLTRPDPADPTLNASTEQLLRSADGVVLLVGKQPTPRVEHEWSLILMESWRRPELPLIPVLWERCTPPAFLRTRQGIRLRNGSPANAEATAESIAAALRTKKAAKVPAANETGRALQRRRLDVLQEQAKAIEPTTAALRNQAKALEKLLVAQQAKEEPEVAETARRLGDLMKSLREPERALHYQQVALNSLLQHQGESNRDAARVHASVAMTLESLNRNQEAIEHLKRSLHSYTQSVGRRTVSVSMSELRLARLLRKMGQLDAARTHERRSQEALKAASWDFVTHLPVVGKLIRRAAKRAQARGKVPAGKTAGRSQQRTKPTSKRTGSAKTKSATVGDSTAARTSTSRKK